MLDWALSRRRTVVVIALGVFALAMVAAAARLGSEFLPELNEGTFWANFDMPSSVSSEEAAKILLMARTALTRIGT